MSRASTDLTHVGSSAWVAPASSATLAPTYPSGMAENDLVEAVLVIKPDTATVATPTDWTLVGSVSGGSGAVGGGTGPLAVHLYRRLVPSGGLSGSQSFTITGGSSPVGYMRAWRASGLSLIYETELLTSYSRTSSSTVFGGTAAAGLSLETKDAVTVVVAAPDDQPTTITVDTLTATGATFGTLTQDPAGTVVNAQGNDIGAASAYAVVTSGSSSAAPVVTATGSNAETGMGCLFRVRATVDSLISVAATRATTWVTCAAKTASRSSTWGVGGPVSATRATTWGTSASVSATRLTTWVARTSVGTSCATQWSARGTSAATRATTWQTRGTQTASRASVWSTRAAVTATRGSVWATASRLTTERPTIWAVLTNVGLSSSVPWNAHGVVGVSDALRWDTRAAVGVSEVLPWNSRSTAGVSNDLYWDALQSLATTCRFDWTVVQAAGIESVAGARSIVWDVRARVAATKSTSWATNGACSATRSSLWTTRASVAVSSPASIWSARTSASAARTTSWLTAGPVNVFRLTLWDTNTAVGHVVVTRDASWLVAGTVVVGRELTWDSLARVTSGYALGYAGGGYDVGAIGGWTIRWAVGAKCYAVRPTSWGILTSVGAQDMLLPWTTRTLVATSRQLLSRTNALSRSTHLLRWRVGPFQYREPRQPTAMVNNVRSMVSVGREGSN